jgi:mannose-1-phosphate guanylyltransferase
MHAEDPVWCVVLAAGRGTRLAEVTGGVPKQFWAPDGTRSLLEATLARTAAIAPPSRTVTVVDRSQATLLAGVAAQVAVGRAVYQPSDRGTAAGLLLGLTELPQDGRDAIVLVTPSDHGIARPAEFLAGARDAIAHVQAQPSRLVLFGARPSSPASDLGWITPSGGDGPGTCIRPVASFVEKPSAENAERLFADGALWNTMVLVAQVRALRELYRRYLAGVARVFDEATRLVGGDRQRFLTRVYPTLPVADFSRDVLTPASDLDLYPWPAGLGWTDLGTPERLERWREAARAWLVPSGLDRPLVSTPG